MNRNINIKLNNRVNKGTVFGVFSGMLWGLDTVLIGLILEGSVFSEFTFTAPLIAVFLHDSFSSLWIFIYMIVNKKTGDILSAIKSKSGLFLILASLFAGPVGMTGYVLAISYIGSSYTATISSMYPAIGAFFAYVFLKDKLNLRGVVGLILAISATVFLGVSSSTGEGQSNLLGFIFAFMCTVGWGLECVICSYGMKGDIKPDIALQIRQLTSAISYAIVIIPIFNAYPGVLEVIKTSQCAFLALTALIGTLSYFCYYSAIDSIGPTRAMGLNISYSAWAVIIGVFVGVSLDFKVLLICIVIILGSILTCDNPGEIFYMIVPFIKKKENVK